MKYKNRSLRHELKFPATKAQCEILAQRFAAVMKPDKNGENGVYRVTSLYLDDVYRSGYNDKINGADTRKKYRIRTYGLSPDLLTLECKYKDRDMTSKRTVKITAQQYRQILSGDFSFAYSDELGGTVAFDASLSNSLALLRPAVTVDYTRQAFVNEEGNVRFTIDSSLRAGIMSRDMLSPDMQFVPVTDFSAVVEIKYEDYLPSFLSALLDGVKLRQESVSKYVLCSDKLTKMHCFTTGGF